jgi:hypothetical protein
VTHTWAGDGAASGTLPACLLSSPVGAAAAAGGEAGKQCRHHTCCTAVGGVGAGETIAGKAAQPLTRGQQPGYCPLTCGPCWPAGQTPHSLVTYLAAPGPHLQPAAWCGGPAGCRWRRVAHTDGGCMHACWDQLHAGYPVNSVVLPCFSLKSMALSHACSWWHVPCRAVPSVLYLVVCSDSRPGGAVLQWHWGAQEGGGASAPHTPDSCGLGPCSWSRTCSALCAQLREHCHTHTLGEWRMQSAGACGVLVRSFYLSSASPHPPPAWCCGLGGGPGLGPFASCIQPA